MSDMNGNGLELGVGKAKLIAQGIVVIQLLLSLGLGGMIGYQYSQHEQIVDGLNDLFLAAVLTEEQKKHLPELVRQKVEEIIQRKAEKMARMVR